MNYRKIVIIIYYTLVTLTNDKSVRRFTKNLRYNDEMNLDFQFQFWSLAHIETFLAFRRVFHIQNNIICPTRLSSSSLEDSKKYNIKFTGYSARPRGQQMGTFWLSIWLDVDVASRLSLRTQNAIRWNEWTLCRQR